MKGRLTSLMKSTEMATEASSVSTTCAQPLGTYRISPASCTPSHITCRRVSVSACREPIQCAQGLVGFASLGVACTDVWIHLAEELVRRYVIVVIGEGGDVGVLREHHPSVPTTLVSPTMW